jgi:hypothetical protein
MPAANLSRRAVQEPFLAVGVGSGAEVAFVRAGLCESALVGAVQVLTLRGLTEGTESWRSTKGSTLRALCLRFLAIVVRKNLRPSDHCYTPSPRDCRSNL